MSINWENIKIKDIANINVETYSSKEDWDFVNYLDTSNITENKIDEIKFIDLTKEKLPSRAKRKVSEFSILFSTVRPNQKHYGIVKDVPENFLVSTAFVVIDANKSKIDSYFLYYLLVQNEVIEFLNMIAEQSTSTYPSIKPSDIEDLYFLFPPLKEQQKISRILSSLDEKIEINRKINENLEEQAKTIFKRWFIDYEFPNEEGKPYKSSGGEMVESEMGLIPKGWEIRKVSEIIRFIKGKKPKIISDKYFYGSQKYLTIEVLNGITNLYCTGNNIINSSELDNLIVADGAKSGTIYYAQDGIVGSTLFKMELICEYISNDYIYFLFKLYENEIKLNKTGSAIPHLDRKYVENILITIPGIEFGNKNIFNFLNYIRLLVIRNSEQIQKLTQIRDTLLPKLMTGEIDVSNIDI